MTGSERAPLILQARPGARADTRLPVIAAMLRQLAEAATGPVVTHLDPGAALEACRRAIGAGFTAGMFDGLHLALAQNIAETATVAALARAAGAGCQGKVGVVGDAGGQGSIGTDPEPAPRFARETGVDAVAVSVGNLRLQRGASAAPLDRARPDAIAALTPLPLVIHGGSGVAPAERQRLAAQTTLCIFNIGTELRQSFGAALRIRLAADPGLFDRLASLKSTEAPVTRATRAVLRSLLSHGRV